MAPRDVYEDVLSNHYPNGTIRTVCYDNPEDDLPVTNGVVRMIVPMAGFEFVPDPNDPNKCTLKFILECDLGGNIPIMVQSLVI